MDTMDVWDRDDQQILDRLGMMLRDARKRRGLTQIELAAMAHMSPTVVGRVENGLQGISALRLARLALILDISLDALLDVEMRST